VLFTSTILQTLGKINQMELITLTATSMISALASLDGELKAGRSHAVSGWWHHERALFFLPLNLTHAGKNWRA